MTGNENKQDRRNSDPKARNDQKIIGQTIRRIHQKIHQKLRNRYHT